MGRGRTDLSTLTPNHGLEQNGSILLAGMCGPQSVGVCPVAPVRAMCFIHSQVLVASGKVETGWEAQLCGVDRIDHAHLSFWVAVFTNRVSCASSRITAE